MKITTPLITHVILGGNHCLRLCEAARLFLGTYYTRTNFLKNLLVQNNEASINYCLFIRGGGIDDDGDFSKEHAKGFIEDLLSDFVSNMDTKDLLLDEDNNFSEKLDELRLLASSFSTSVDDIDQTFVDICFDKALKGFEQVLDKKNKSSGGANQVDDSAVALAYMGTGIIHLNRKEYDQALSFFLKAVDEKYETCHRKTELAYMLGNIGRIYYEKDQLDKAMIYLAKARQIYNTLLEGSHLEVKDEVYFKKNAAIADATMGYVYNKKRHFEEALQCFHKELALRVQIDTNDSGTGSTEIATCHINIGNCYNDMQRPDQALKCYSTALRYMRTPDHNPILFANFYYFSGIAYVKLRQFDQSEKNYLKCISINENCFGKDHKKLANPYHKFGQLLMDKGDITRSRQYLSKALKIYQREFGESHVNCADVYSSFGNTFMETGDLDLCMEYYLKALAIYKAKYGEDHSEMTTVLFNLGGLHFYKRDFDIALEYYFKAITIHKKDKHIDYPSLAQLYTNVANIYLELERFQDSLEYLFECRIIYEKILRADKAFLSQVDAFIAQVKSKMN